MADTFGLKIGLEGEKDFKKSLAEINSTFKVLGSEMKLVESQFDKNDKSVESLTARNGVLEKSIEAQKQKIETLRAALENASTSFGENDKRTQAWQIKLNEAEAALNNMERELKDNNAALDDAAHEFDDAGDQADDFGEEVDDAGEEADDAGNKFEKLGSICKAAGAAIGAAFAAVSAAAVAAGKALVDMSKEGAAYADTVLTESTVTGIATNKLQEYMYAAELVDVSTDTLTKSMAKQIKSMKSAADGSKTMVAAYDQLGVSVTDANGNLRDSDTVYWEIIDALGKVENETERDALYDAIDPVLKKLGIEFTFVDPDADEKTIQKAFRPNTKCVFGETVANPSGAILDIAKFAKIAHRNGVPLIVDNTFPTPVLCRPFRFGCDIVTHATTKYMDGHSSQVGGCIVDSGNFDWAKHADKFPGLVEPDEMPKIAGFLEKKGLACSVYFAQYLLEAFCAAGRADIAVRLMASSGDRSWKGMIDFGSTITMEAWNMKAKPNQDLNHAWGSAPLNVISRCILGVTPLKPGFDVISIAPQPGGLRSLKAEYPHPSGAFIRASWSFVKDRARFFHDECAFASVSRLEAPSPSRSL